MRVRATRLTSCLLALAAPVRAQTTQGDPGQGTGPLPTNAAPSPAPICTDRPTKANVACTVPARDVQIESGVLDWTRMSGGGARTDTILYTDPTLKYGVGTHTEIEVNIAPYETVHTVGGGTRDTLVGVGDLYLRLKQRLTPDQAKTQVALIPFVKAPTASRGIGDGEWEGGVISAENIPLPAHFTLTLGPELDILANDGRPGHHVGLVSLVNLSHPVGKRLNVYAEFWNEREFAPGGTVREASGDVAVSFQLSKTLQLDGGANIGLTRATPDVEAYVGMSTRF